MPPLPRIFSRLPSSARSYSSFFSSKPGGGRYFNSSKPAKTPVVAAAPKNKGDSTKSPEAPSEDSTEVKAASTSPAQDAPAPATASPSKAPAPVAPDTNVPPHPLSAFAAVSQHYAASHPVVSPKDFKLHQFFSLHRPLLLIHHPPSILEPAPEGASLIPATLESGEQTQQQNQQQPTSPFDDIYDGAAVDADAEAARQLTRALTMNSAGAAMAWESTLRRLGLDPDKDPERVGLQEQMDKEWNDVLMESTKKRRRKKMNKHKLTKRRRKTRASRQRAA